MVKPRRGVLFLATGGLLAAAWLLWPHAPAPAPPRAAPTPVRRGRVSSPDELPRIDLARLDDLEKRELVAAGPRDISTFPTPPPPPPPPQVVETPPMVAAAPTGPPPPPPLNMTYLGSLESRAGLRVAVFVTDKKTVLTGREGEVVGSRVRVMKIGLESVDVEDLTSGRSQRMALPKKGGGGDAAKDPRDKERGGSSR